MNAAGFLQLALWTFVWGAGGVWIARGAFSLHPREEGIVGFATGLVVQVGLANFLVRFLPVPGAAWLSALLVLVLGAWLVLRSEKLWGKTQNPDVLGALNPGHPDFANSPLPPQRGTPGVRPKGRGSGDRGVFLSNAWRGLLRLRLCWQQGLALAGMFVLFFAISRGMAIFDDYAQLPTLSNMARGDVPPHFSLNPQVVYTYHYFTLLFSAQVMRLAGLFPWVAWDAGRVLSVALAVLLAALWARRVTRSLAAGLAAAMMTLFGGGARWLLLLLPGGVLARVSSQLHMLGTGSQSGATLLDALLGPWIFEGSGPLPLPFAFANGIQDPGVLAIHTANGMMDLVLIFLFLLTFNRWRAGWAGLAVSVVFFSTTGLLAEVDLPVTLAGWVIVTLGWMALRRSVRLPLRLKQWWLVALAGSLIVVVQGGAWTGVLSGLLAKWLSGTVTAYPHTFVFSYSWVPALVSGHLGVLDLFNPAQALAAACEAGPLLLVLPLIAIWGWRALRAARWFEAALAATAIASLGLLFVQYAGSTGVRNSTRLYLFLPLCLVFAVPAAWLWVARRSQELKTLVFILGAAACLGGAVMLAFQLPAIQKPVSTYFITRLDEQVMSKYWDRLAPGALVFDPNPIRAATVFGRLTKSSTNWYVTLPEWDALALSPDPSRLRQAGFSYAYLDEMYWNQLPQPSRQALQGACVQVLDEERDSASAFRRLIDLRGCP